MREVMFLHPVPYISFISVTQSEYPIDFGVADLV